MLFERYTFNSNDQQLAQVVQQAINDNEAVSSDLRNVQVTVNDGNVILGGTVPTDKEMNLITNTAEAFAPSEKVANHLEVSHRR